MSITPQDLVSTVASLLNMPVNTVKNYDRQLMEAGLRTKKGHGRGSAIMTPRDAGMLLMAIASSEEISRAVECVSKVRELPSTVGDPSILCKVIGGSRGDYATFGVTVDAIMKHLAENDRDETAAFEVLIYSGEPFFATVAILHKHSEKQHSFNFGRSDEEVKSLVVSRRGLGVRRAIFGNATSYLAACIAGRKPVLHPKGAV